MKATHISLSDWLQHCVDDDWAPADLPALERIWRDKWPDEAPTSFIVKHRRITLKMNFNTWSGAFLWALDNYKGTTLAWRVHPGSMVEARKAS